MTSGALSWDACLECRLCRSGPFWPLGIQEIIRKNSRDHKEEERSKLRTPNIPNSLGRWAPILIWLLPGGWQSQESVCILCPRLGYSSLQ